MKLAQAVPITVALCALCVAPTNAQVSFGTATISGSTDDPSASSPLTGYSFSVSGNTVTLSLPNFTAGAFTSSVVNVSIPFTVNTGFAVTGDKFLFSGTFTNAGFATGTETLQNNSGSVSRNSILFLPPSPASGTQTLTSGIQSGYLITQVNLGDDTQDGTSAVDTIQQTLSVAPEPSGWVVIGVGAMLILGSQLKRVALRGKIVAEENV